MNTIRGRGVAGGSGEGRALVTRMPMNFTASFTKPTNMLPGWRARIQDRHHELLGKNLKGRVLVYPATIGSTYTGLVLLELIYRGSGPAAIVVQRADSLMVSGSILAESWLEKTVPVVEYPSDDLFDKIRDGDHLRVDGDTGEIRVG